MKQIIGSPARKEQFYKREDIRDDILNSIENGENILISAPRRVGKTSILLDLIDNPDPNVFAVYINTEAIEDPEDFFKLMLKNVLNTDRIEGFGKFGKVTRDFLTKWGNIIGGINIGGVGIEIKEGEKVSYFNQLLEFLSDIKLEGKRIVILVDEFPITIEHINRKYGENGVRLFLDQNRAIRQNPDFQEKVKFIYCGSIGLFTVIKRLKATDRINDVREIKIAALRKNDAIDFINNLLLEKTGMTADTKLMSYILHKIEWWIPFYFQLLVKELSDLINYDEEGWVNATVDKAFENVVKNGNIYFEHAKARLDKIENINEAAFKKEVLFKLSQNDVMKENELLNLAEKHLVRNEFDNYIDELIFEGYIIDELKPNGDKQYKFYSPILKRWWR